MTVILMCNYQLKGMAIRHNFSKSSAVMFFKNCCWIPYFWGIYGSRCPRLLKFQCNSRSPCKCRSDYPTATVISSVMCPGYQRTKVVFETPRRHVQMQSMGGNAESLLSYRSEWKRHIDSLGSTSRSLCLQPSLPMALKYPRMPCVWGPSAESKRRYWSRRVSRAV